jgi:hypothetical protein
MGVVTLHQIDQAGVARIAGQYAGQRIRAGCSGLGR